MTIASSFDSVGRAVPPPVIPGADALVIMSERFAAMSSDKAEQLIDAYVVEAVSQWRVADATFWQRVKFRARLLRAIAKGRSGDARKGETA